jgi:hypothetical protein
MNSNKNISTPTRFISLAKCVLLISAAVTAAAQKNDWTRVTNLPIGSEIRVALDTGKSYRGQLQNVAPDSLIVVAAASPETLPRAQIKKIATKADSRRLRNTLIGLGIGAGAGLGLGAGSDASCNPHCLGGNNIGKEVLTPIGAIVGAIVGVAWPTGRWHEIYRM